jgi:[ribosomal protein S5]-alanine N-acetyltransferase
MTAKTAARRRPRLPFATERLLLREFVAADLEAYRALVLDARVAKHLPHAPDDEAAAELQFARTIGMQQRVKRQSWELAATQNGELIGAGDLTVTEPGMMNLGYAIARRHWRQGYATELARGLARLAFEDLCVPRLYATISIDNQRSIAVAEKIGLRWEATLRGRVKARGRSWDMHLFVVDREDWLTQNGEAVG